LEVLLGVIETLNPVTSTQVVCVVVENVSVFVVLTVCIIPPPLAPAGTPPLGTILLVLIWLITFPDYLD
jgi:hypothetical protein